MKFFGLFRKKINNTTGADRQDKSPAGQFATNELRAILDHIPMFVFWKDLNSVYRGGNLGFARMVGLSCGDLDGKTDFDIHTAESAEFFREEDLNFISGERTEMSFADRLVHMKDMGDMWSRIYKIPVRGEDGQIRFILGLIQDITEIKRSELALAESESRLRAILNATADSIVFAAPDGTVLAANGSFAGDFVPGKEDPVGRNLGDMLPPLFLQKIRENIELSVKSGVPHYFDLWPGETDTEKYFDVSVYPVATDSGITGAAVYLKDITRRKQAEDMLIKRGDQLQSAKTEAENASRSKSDFLSRMSHEIRTPIGAIIGMTKIAAGSDNMIKIMDCLNKIDSSSKHLLDLINDILDMSKIEAGKFILSDTEFRLETMFMNIANVVDVRANEKNQNFEVILDSTLPEYFFADELRLRQVTTNLLSNAIKFTPEYGTIRLFVNNLGVECGVATVEVIVSDTGIGLTVEQLDRLFTPFEQAEGGISRKYGGSGLGLAICKKIVDMMGGDIRVESEPGAGSKFTFNVKMRSSSTTEPELGRIIKFPDMRALIVDDSPEAREYLSHILGKFGVRSETAADGFEATRIVADTKNGGDPFNIFFVDWSMPGMDGVETSRKIKAIMDDNAVVIMISITEWEKIEHKAKAAGVDRYIAKPLFPSTVLDILNEIAGTSTEEKKAEFDGKSVPDLSGFSILLTEDIEINREIANALLEPTNVRLDFAANGREAVEKYNARNGGYDLILMDIHMPEMDGYEATRRIRAIGGEKSRTIPIVAMTADAFKEDIEKCRAAGMNNHVAKPINEDELFRKIRLCLGLTGKSGKRREPSGNTNVLMDEREAMRRLNGNSSLYKKLLGNFLTSNGYESLLLRARSGNYDGAAQSAHALRGMAANLSLKSVALVVGELEDQLKNGIIDEESLHAVGGVIDETTALISQYISDGE